MTMKGGWTEVRERLAGGADRVCALPRGLLCVVLPCCLVAGGHPAEAGALEDYVRACEAPGVTDRESAVACTAFAKRLSDLTSPAPEERLALFRARAWLGHYSGSTVERCDDFRAVAEDLLHRPDVLFGLAVCSYWPLPSGPDGRHRADENLVSLLREALALDPGHVAALDLLIHRVRARGYGYGVDAADLAGYAATLYGLTGGLGAAEAAFEAFLDAGDPDGAESIRERVRRDLGLDALDYGPQRREDSLALACSEGLFGLGLEDACLSAVEMLAAAADSGETIPRDVLGHARNAVERLRRQARLADVRKDDPEMSRRYDHEAWADGGRSRQAERLRAVLGTHPEPLKSSEHYLAYAATAPSWGKHIDALRRAVELDRGNPKARCGLAGALTATGAWAEARSIYVDLAAVDDKPPCDAEAGLRQIEEMERSFEAMEKHGGVAKMTVSPDDPFPFPH